MSKKLSFVATDVRISQERNDAQFATLYVDAFASGHNRNDIYISDETLQRTAWTLLDKPLLWAYDKRSNDAGSHDKAEIPCGFIPSSNNLTFTRTEDGRTMLSVVAKVWKHYSGLLVDFFKRDNSQKPVSVEIEVLDSNLLDDGVLEITDFAYSGITILGTKIMPAIPGAKALVLNFEQATSEYNKAYEMETSKVQGEGIKEFVEEGDIIVDIEQVVQEQELINKDEQKTPPIEEKPIEVIEPEAELKEPIVTVDEPKVELVEPIVIVEEPEPEAITDVKSDLLIEPQLPFVEIREYFDGDTEFSEVIDSGDNDKIIGYLFKKLKEKDTVLEETKSEFEQVSKEAINLNEFKAKFDADKLGDEIKTTLGSIKDGVSQDVIDKLLESSKAYTLEDIELWKNEAMATAFRASLVNKPQAKTDISASLVDTPKEKKSGEKMLW